MVHDTTLAVDPGQELAGPRVEVAGPRFRVQTARFSTQWLPDTPSHRHLTLVWLRLLVDAHGKPLFTWQALAALVGSTNRQAASQHLEDFRQCGEDMRAFVLRKRKVDTTVVEGVLHGLLQTPLAGSTALVPRVQARLARHALSVANIERALEQISCVPVLRVLRRQLETGQVHYQEAWRLTELLESLALPAPPACRLERPHRRSRDAARRSPRPGGAGDPGAAAGPGARLPVLADRLDDALLLECPALGAGTLVWRPQDHGLTLGVRTGARRVADGAAMDGRGCQSPAGLCG